MASIRILLLPVKAAAALDQSNDYLVIAEDSTTDDNRKVTVGSFVLTAQDQTIAGKKTFTTLPEVPTDAPTLPAQVASKSYVDSQVATGGTTFQVSAADTTPGYGEDKIVAGEGIAITKLNPAGDEELEVGLDFSAVSITSITFFDGATERTATPSTAGSVRKVGEFLFVSLGITVASPSGNVKQVRILFDGVTFQGGPLGGSSAAQYITASGYDAAANATLGYDVVGEAADGGSTLVVKRGEGGNLFTNTSFVLVNGVLRVD